MTTPTNNQNHVTAALAVIVTAMTIPAGCGDSGGDTVWAEREATADGGADVSAGGSSQAGRGGSGGGGLAGAAVGGSAGAEAGGQGGMAGAATAGKGGTDGASVGGASGGGSAGTGGGSAGTGGSPPVDCSGISAHPDFELCGSGASYCEGIFKNYNGCVAFCAAAGLACTKRYGGEPGCKGPELNNPLSCGDNTGHQSDWCHCEGPAGTGGAAGTGGSGGNPNCPVNPSNPPTARKLNFKQAVYTNRSAWVLQCHDYAYTAYQAEHEACDPQYHAGSSSGIATFTFPHVPQGMYNVYFQGRHTTNRNPKGTLVIVSSGGQSWPKRIMQRDNKGYPKDLHGTYCLSGTVKVVLDSTSTASDSVQNVYLAPQ